MNETMSGAGETPKMTKVHQHRFTLSAAQCNAQCELSAAGLVQHIIELATEHADLLNCGFERLQSDGMLWVLSRLAFEMKRMPRLQEKYVISTWIESYNRHFSQRNFDIRSATGEVLGYARSIWVAIDRESRRPANLEGIAAIAATVSDRPCPIEAPRKLRMERNVPASVRNYTFKVSDIDFNRHVNSGRYVELMLNSLSLSDFDENRIARFDIDYKLESHYGDVATVAYTRSADGTVVSDITVEGREVCICRYELRSRADYERVSEQA